MLRWFARFAGAALLCAAVILEPAHAYIDRGTVHITADTEAVTLTAGSVQVIPVALDPAQDDQMPGCGMADCPDGCGNCLTPDGNCPCDGTEYETYYTEVLTSSSDPAVAEAVWENGQLLLTAHRAGTCTLKLSARLREYTGSSAELAVTVTSGGVSPVPWIGAGCGVFALAVVGIIVIKKRRSFHET